MCPSPVPDYDDNEINWLCVESLSQFFDSDSQEYVIFTCPIGYIAIDTPDSDIVTTTQEGPEE